MNSLLTASTLVLNSLLLLEVAAEENTLGEKLERIANDAPVQWEESWKQEYLAHIESILLRYTKNSDYQEQMDEFWIGFPAIVKGIQPSPVLTEYRHFAKVEIKWFIEQMLERPPPTSEQKSLTAKQVRNVFGHCVKLLAREFSKLDLTAADLALEDTLNEYHAPLESSLFPLFPRPLEPKTVEALKKDFAQYASVRSELSMALTSQTSGVWVEEENAPRQSTSYRLTKLALRPVQHQFMALVQPSVEMIDAMTQLREARTGREAQMQRHEAAQAEIIRRYGSRMEQVEIWGWVIALLAGPTPDG